MNYYPFYNLSPMTYTAPVSRGLLGRLFGGINLGSILNGTQRTINFVNQAIPVVKQVSPLMKNARTMFRVMNEFKKTDSKKTSNSTKKVEVNENTPTNNGPTFFL